MTTTEKVRRKARLIGQSTWFDCAGMSVEAACQRVAREYVRILPICEVEVVEFDADGNVENKWQRKVRQRVEFDVMELRGGE
jgi:hypothetical protein